MRFRSLALIICALALVPATLLLRPAAEHAWFVWQLALADPPAQLPSPVAQVPRGKLANTWGADRGGRRAHEGIDIFAPRDTPVRSTTRGIVTRVGTNRLGGQVVFVLGPGLESHYYAHLERFAEIRPGDIVQAGDVLGYVGRTANARTTPFHLHYGIYHRGTPQNPYPRLTAHNRRDTGQGSPSEGSARAQLSGVALARTVLLQAQRSAAAAALQR